MRSKQSFLLSISFCLLIINGLAQTDEVRMYAFGHSLIDHRPPAIATPSDETTVMHWVYDIAQAAGDDFSGGGQYGFLTNHDDLPPIAQWGYDMVPAVWDDQTETFAEADINTILITVANFIQYQPPHLDHPLDNSTTVIEATENIFDWVAEQEDSVRYFIYANWPEMDLQQAYPPTPPLQSEVDDFHQQTIGRFTDWWKVYQDSMMVSRPELKPRLIPVGMIISKILQDVIPGQVPFTELYEDSDPHGRANIYFLAGMITYMATYGKPMPMTYAPDMIIHQTIRDSLGTIHDFVWQELLTFNFPNGDSRVFTEISTTSIDHETIQNPAIRLFPNPTFGEITLSGMAKGDEIEIFNAIGIAQPVITTQSQSIKVDLSSLADGIYFIRIFNKMNQQYWIKKIVKR